MPWHIKRDDLAITGERFELRSPPGQVQTDRMEQEQWRSIAFDCCGDIDRANGVNIDKNGKSPILPSGSPSQQRPDYVVTSRDTEARDVMSSQMRDVWKDRLSSKLTVAWVGAGCRSGKARPSRCMRSMATDQSGRSNAS